MEQNIKKYIEEAEMILVGIGREFAPLIPAYDEASELAPYLKSRFLREISDEHEIIRAYGRLRELIGAKPYFVVTLNTDDLIYRSTLESDLIVAPCGSMSKLQCSEHIVDAAEICDHVLAAGDPELARCPKCGALLHFHTVAEEGYLESGYQQQWDKYTKWLSCTLNRKLLLLELGTDFQYPQVIRWAFEKTAFYNMKSKLVRISSKFPQLPAELSERGVAVAEKPVEFLLKH